MIHSDVDWYQVDIWNFRRGGDTCNGNKNLLFPKKDTLCLINMNVEPFDQALFIVKHEVCLTFNQNSILAILGH